MLNPILNTIQSRIRGYKVKCVFYDCLLRERSSFLLSKTIHQKENKIYLDISFTVESEGTVHFNGVHILE